MCDEIVTLWRLAALNPSLSPIQRDDLCQQLKDWHIKTIDKVRKTRGANMPGNNAVVKKADIEVYSGFKAGIEACQLDWTDYPIYGVTYVERDWPRWCFSFTKFQDGEGRRMGRKGHGVSQTTGVPPRLGLEAALHAHQSQHHQHHHPHPHHRSQSQENNTSDLEPGSAQTDGACSSSSEGFCENDRLDGPSHSHDSDSDLGVDGMMAPPPGGSSRTVEGASVAPSMVKSASCTVGGTVVTMQLVGDVRTVKAEDMDSDNSLPGPSGYHNSTKSNGAHMVASSVSGASASSTLPGKGEESQQSSDEYQVYFFDANAKVNEPGPEKKKKSDEPNYFAGIRKLESRQEVSAIKRIIK